MHDAKISHYLIPIVMLLVGGLVVLAVWSQRTPENTVNNNHEMPIDLGLGNLPPLGDENAPITLIEFSDFQCPFCASFFTNTEMIFRSELIETGKMKIYWRDFAFLGPESELAAEAARCANDQDQFWQYHDLLFLSQGEENQGEFNKNSLGELADGLGLDREQFDQCLDSNKYRDAVREDTRVGRDLGIQGTPTVFINGERIVGAQPYEVFEVVINKILKELEK